MAPAQSCSSQHDIDQEAEKIEPELDWGIAHKVDPQSHLLQQGSSPSQPLKAVPLAGDHMSLWECFLLNRCSIYSLSKSRSFTNGTWYFINILLSHYFCTLFPFLFPKISFKLSCVFKSGFRVS